MNWRYRVTLGILTCFFLLVVVRLFYWQVVKADELTRFGQSQYGRPLRIDAIRGTIKTSDEFAVAANKISYLLFASPKEIKPSEKEKTAGLLSSLLKIEEASVSAALSRDKLWVPVHAGVSSEQKSEISSLKLPGIGFEQQNTRFYPEGSMAAQLLGFVGRNDVGEDKGYFGLEGYYDRQLRGKRGKAVHIQDALGRPIVARLSNDSDRIDGRSLILSLDRVIQFSVEKKLLAGIAQYQASGGMAAVINPKNGAVLAMASYPSFDQRRYREFEDSVYKNPFIVNLYEPGSTFKSLIMSAGIDSGVVKPETKCPICQGPVQIGEYAIRTWNNKYRDDITMTEVIQHSDNTGMVYVGKTLGLDRMLEYLEKFGIGDLTGIDLQGEVSPGLRPRDEWYPIDLATASFGQGIHVTPLELLVGFASLANEGRRMEPHVVAKIQTPEGETIPIEPKELSRPVSAKTAKIMTEILVNAVDNGEAKWAKPKGYRIAGKTGTAQIPIAGHYDPNKTIASFIGFAPADDPRFAMLVIIDRPTTSIYGSETAAPIFFDIARDLFSYYQISPSE